MFLIVTVPVLIGMLLKNILSSFEGIAKNIYCFVFLVLLGAVLAERENVITYFAQAGLITLILNIVMMLIAFILASPLSLTFHSKEPSHLNVDCKMAH